MLHLPVLRAGKPYRSLQVSTMTDVRTGEPVAEVSQALPGMIARDLLQAEANQAALAKLSAAELIDICHRAAKYFAGEELPLGETTTQTPEQYLEQLAATSGMPIALGRANMQKILGVLEGIENVLDGLTRGLDLSVLDGGWGVQHDRQLSYQRQTDTLGAILPNNSPGVHNLWIPAIPLKVPLVLRPGSAEPWTPYRLAQAFLAAGCPPEAWSLYPSSYAGATEVLLRTGRSLFFGDAKTVANWKNNEKIQIHGPGWSKVIFGPDAAEDWQSHVDLLAGSIAMNGGRSCINASSIWTPSHGREIAEALAERLAKVEARPLDDPEAQLAAFPDPEIARRISDLVDQQLAEGGAEDLTARYRDGDRVAEAGGCTFLRPTLVHCESDDNALAQAEYGFPFASVVEVPAEEIFERLGPTLIGTVISKDQAFLNRAIQCRVIDRLNLGAIPTYKLSWDQPHEGNLFDHLYQQRAFQQLALAS